MILIVHLETSSLNLFTVSPRVVKVTGVDNGQLLLMTAPYIVKH